MTSPPAGLTPVFYRPSLLRSDRRTLALEPGLTVAEIVARVEPDPRVQEHVLVLLEGQEIGREWWPRVRPRNGHVLHLVARPGGGSETLRMVLTVAVVAAAISMGPAGAGLLFGGSGFAAAAITAGVSVGGRMAMNALVI